MNQEIVTRQQVAVPNAVHISLNGNQVAICVLNDCHLSAVELRRSAQVIQLNAVTNLGSLKVKIECAWFKVEGRVELCDQALRSRREVSKRRRTVRSNLVSSDTSSDVAFSRSSITDSIAKYKKARLERAFRMSL